MFLGTLKLLSVLGICDVSVVSAIGFLVFNLLSIRGALKRLPLKTGSRAMEIRSLPRKAS